MRESNLDTVLLGFEGDIPLQWTEYIYKETLGRPGTITEPGNVIKIETEKGKEVKILVQRIIN